MSPTHKQIFWTIGVGTGDIGPTKRAQIAKAALTLHQNPAVVHANAAGGYDNHEAPEIALTLHASFEDVRSLKAEVQAALYKEGLPNVAVTLEEEVHWFTFADVEVKALKHSVSDYSLARDTIDELFRKPIGKAPPHPPRGLADALNKLVARLRSHGPLGPESAAALLESVRSTDVGDIPSDQKVEPLLISEDKYSRMKAARDDDVEAEIVGLQKAFSDLATATKTNTAVAYMVASGLLAVGGWMVTAYQAIGAAGSLSAAITSAIASIGGIAALVGIVTAVAAVILLLWVLLKDAVNALFVINGLETKIDMSGDSIINGERFEVTTEIPRADKNPDKPAGYGCGLYTYRKTRVWDYPVGLFGSTAGIAFQAQDNSQFSVGLDCPNTAMGGTNCIRVFGDLDAYDAASSADDTGYSTDTVTTNGHTFTGSRASSWGSINYAICSIE
ncbi:hypothetical protein QBC41DRAFT_301732 [Cercophora samala]|uniref:Uncharacterized protein n=1 Tax=Cercophora samala TaxID=330535 RepID=A0AA39ZG83_9PEZI|nr:hypothetical protein QBC41DRAFT_301732 [Cercophora samala]